MEEPEYECETQGGKGRNMHQGVMDKGLSLGKNILVAGVVLSSVPLLLPPLVVISTMGFLCSVPCGLFLASYACTEKLMSKLMPMSVSSSLFPGFGIFSGNQDVDKSNIGYEKGEKIELSELEEEELGEERDKNGRGVNEENTTSLEISLADTREENLEEDKVAVKQVDDDQPSNVLSREHVGGDGDDKSNTNIVHRDGDKESVKEVKGEGNYQTAESVNVPLQEEKADEGNRVNGEKKNLKSSSAKEVAEKCEVEASSTSEETGSNESTDYEGREAADAQKIAHAKGNIEGNHEKKSTKKHGKKGHKVQEEMWKEINAMRMIVGYKAPPKATMVEELTALYVFVGVEPPFLVQDSGDLDRVNDKLRFLKSIVGVE